MEKAADKEIRLNEVQIDNETYYQITNVNEMRPFFMSIVSDSNHWMFIGSNGGVSAGRKNADFALFPYYTDDKIIENAETTGSKSIFRMNVNGQQKIWEPFSIRFSQAFQISRNLYKSLYGNKIIFEEINHDLGLTYRYQWSSSDQFGFVREVKLINGNDHELKIEVLDGIQNIMPHGVSGALQNASSNLVDAYKRNEIIKESGIGIFALSAMIVDKAEPSEALKANVAWSLGMENPKYLLSSLQLDAFRNGEEISPESDVKAERGAYFISSALTLGAGDIREWMIIANVNQNVSSIVSLSELIRNDKNLASAIHSDVELGTSRLVGLNAAADGLQHTADSLKNARHYSNTLFNIMRGGIFDDNYTIERKDLINYLKQANRPEAEAYDAQLKTLPERFTLQDLRKTVSSWNSKILKRLCLEYLPLKFSRRHGDPSRPWNKFSINTTDENGEKILDYEGNWRDIFQNWEALAHSYPEFIDGMIFRFLNATTFDGYNPYRITKNGIDWERIEPDDPWSYIGYWGDHQIIYLLKFLEFAGNHYPGKLQQYFSEEIFVYANVPYRIKPYADLLRNPKDTIDFDHDLDNKIMDRWPELGADAVLLTDKQGEIHEVNFIEKIMATIMAKMSNFIPEGGIWMNTQRPEWNDANNALVGNGVSVVTLAYLIRFLKFIRQELTSANAHSFILSSELHDYLRKMTGVLDAFQGELSGKISDKSRKLIMDGLGEAGSNYRTAIYKNSFTGKREEVPVSDLLHFINVSLEYAEHTLRANKRDDDLFHAYNLMSVSGNDEVEIDYLSEMLEGQVAALSSLNLSAEEAVKLLNAMEKSDLYRPDQYSYLLYPEKQLPGFMQRNNVPEADIQRSALLQMLLEDENVQIINKDIQGRYHFNGNFRNAADLSQALDQLSPDRYGKLVDSDRTLILGIFEKVFNHKAFTGRSGTFYGYEGLGSIYWHMVSKLLLAVQEVCLKAIHDNVDQKVIEQLAEHYYKVNRGIGVHKPPSLYGAFPTDPYSHTPKTKGAQQPGMTGQVKEDILCRMGELGIEVKEGQLGFNPVILKPEEFLSESSRFSYVDIEQHKHELAVDQGSLCFTHCQVPVVYELSDNESLSVMWSDGTSETHEGLSLDEDTSTKIFQRSGLVKSLIARINVNRLLFN